MVESPSSSVISISRKDQPHNPLNPDEGVRATGIGKLFTDNVAGVRLIERCPKAKRCVNPFRVIQLATDALDEIRREAFTDTRNAQVEHALDAYASSRLYF